MYVCVRVGDSVWDSVPKRVREGSTLYLPQHINKKNVCGNEGFRHTYWATIARLWAEGKSINSVTSLSFTWQEKRLCFMTSGQCQCNCTAATMCLSFFKLQINGPLENFVRPQLCSDLSAVTDERSDMSSLVEPLSYCLSIKKTMKDFYKNKTKQTPDVKFLFRLQLHMPLRLT